MGRTEEYGGKSRGQVINYDPADLILVTDRKSKLFQETAVRPPPQWMIDSILEFGVKQEIVVRKGPLKRGVQLMEVVVGRRRVLSARAANVIRAARGEEPILLRGRVFAGTDEEAVALIQIENHHRELPSMLDDAISARNALDLGTAEATVLERMRWNKGDLRLHLSLLDCDKAVHDAVAGRLISQGAVKALVKLSRDEQPEMVRKLVETGETGAKKAKEAVEAAHPESAEEVAKQPRGRTRAAVTKKLDELKGLEEFAKVKDRPVLAAYITALRWTLGEDCL